MPKPPGDRFVAASAPDCDRQRWLQAGLAILAAGGALALVPATVQAVPLAKASPTVNSKVETALQKPSIKLALRQFPREFQEDVTRLSDAQVRVLYGGVSGTTRLGPVSINNRQAFIQGSWLGKSVWGNVHKSVSDAQQKWKMINTQEAAKLHRLVDQVARFSPQQRTLLADLLVQVWQG